MSNNKKECIVIGAGGHAKSLLASLTSQLSDWIVTQIYDFNKPKNGEKIFNIDVVEVQKENLIQVLKKENVTNIFLGIGSNSDRKILFENLNTHFNFPNFISSSAIVQGEVIMGAGNIILERVYIGPFSKLGSNNIFNTNAIIEHDCIIGDHNHLSPRTVISGYSNIKNEVFICTGAAVANKMNITSNVTIAAGGAVYQDINSPGLYAGVPAIFKRTNL